MNKKDLIFIDINIDSFAEIEASFFSNKLEIKFVVKHADIPLTCDDCSKDLIDHQTYHKIFYTRCKQEMLCFSVQLEKYF